MSADDQQFLDTIFALPTDILTFSIFIIEHSIQTLESLTDSAALSLREAVGRAPPPPPPAAVRRALRTAAGNDTWYSCYSQRCVDWVWRHRALVAGVLAFSATGGVLVHRRRRGYLAKRRAGRNAKGGRREVVVLVGDLGEGVVRSLVGDLERRLFVVHVVCASGKEEEVVGRVGKRDVKALHLDVTDPFDVEQSLQNFGEGLKNSNGDLHLAGLVVVPDSHYTDGPIQQLHPEVWADAFNTRLVHTIATVQAFTPLVMQHRSRILMLTPTISSSVHTPFHGVENVTIAALESFTQTLHAEMSRFGADVVRIRLGNFKLENQDKTALVRNASSEVLSWPQTIKEQYGEAYMALADNFSSDARGSPLRELHNAVFDALTQHWRPSSIISVGRGSRLYPLVGQWAPTSLVAWMMGSR